MRTVLLVTLVAMAALGPAAAADTLELPTPDAAQLASTELLRQLPNFRPDRLLPSDVPGPVVNDEVVRVGVDGGGGVARVLVDQRLQLQGEGDYAVRERGPARSATSLSEDPPPVTRLGAVVWQGFSPGRRDLAARLTMDPLIEGVHLPLRVEVVFTGRDGRAAPLPDGGAIPGPGTITVTVTNTTSQPQALPTAADADAVEIAGVLDRALAVARRPSAARLPNTDAGLPRTLEVTDVGQVAASQAVPLRLRGSLRLTGTSGRVEGPATTATADGATFVGTLGGSAPASADASVAFTVTAEGPGELSLDLTAVGALNPTELAPPEGFASWARWAAARPPVEQRRQALDLLVAVAATGARASSYSPYLGADLVGSGSTTFVYGFAPPAPAKAAAVDLEPRWGAISLTAVAVLLLLGNATLLWRES